jgi:hypothetical protein
MKDPPLLVTAGVQERRRVALSPDLQLAWRLVGWAGFALLLAPLVEVLSGGRSASPSSGVASAITDRGHLLVLGSAFVLASAIARGQIRAAHSGVAVALALGVAMLVAALAEVVGAPDSSMAAVDLGARLMRHARMRQASVALVYGIVLLALGSVAWHYAFHNTHVEHPPH